MTKDQQILAKMGGGSLAMLLSLSLGQQASATTLVSNLPPITSSLTTGGAVQTNSWLRSSFTTGGGSGYTLNSVTLLSRQITASANLFVRLYENNLGLLGNLITTFTNPGSITTSDGNNTFTLTTPQPLAANTSFWLVAGINGSVGTGGEYSWRGTNSLDQTGESGWSIGDTSRFSGNQGLSWNTSTIANAFQFSVNGTVNTPPPPPTNIPEPGSVVALLGLGGLGLASRLKKLSTRA